ncbi:diacylglycerol lipase-beta isoform X2 [Augochlora pura]
MPAIKLFGRKWLAATDDLVYPGLFEIFIRAVWFILIGTACLRYYQYTWNCQLGGVLVRVFLLGQLTYLLLTMVFMLLIVRYSVKGSIMDTKARKYVEPLLTVKILLLLPEIAWNVLGSIWMFGGSVKCSYDHYTTTVVQALVLFDWILIGLTIFGLALIFDPLGSIENKNLENLAEHSKLSSLWLRRFKFLWWMRKDESADETFQHIAGLLTGLFRGTDLVPSDVVAGSILLRIRRKREIHELRRLRLFADPVTTTDASVIFANTPSWMNLELASHYIKLSIACYGWLYAIYMHTCTGCFRVLQNLTCCSCFRRKRTVIIGDNCCYCYLAGFKYMSDWPVDDILYASFKNYLCEAHSGMIVGAKVILKQLKEHKILERAFNTHPNYDLMLTGHSLGAGISILLAFLLRPQYPNVKVYAFATPAGLLSREVARISEEFVFTIGVGDDFVMRLGVDSIENLRTSLVMTLQACRLPKYRVVMNGLGYMLSGIPEKDLNKTWSSCNIITTSAGQSPLLSDRDAITAQDDIKYDRDITRRRFSKVRLYIGGKILHITKIKSKAKESEGKSKKESSKEKKYGMRWAQPEEFKELIVMPRMLLDHLPETIEHAVNTLIKQQNDLPYYFDP